MIKKERNIWDTLQNVDRRILYVILLVLTSIGVMVPKELPVEPDSSSVEVYITFMTMDPSKPVLLQSDWTNSTRGENQAHLEATLRIFMSRGIKFVLYTLADPQAPQVARNVISLINFERSEQGLSTYTPWVDYLDLGYFPNAEGQAMAMRNNIRTAWANRRALDTTGVQRDVFESPVLAGVREVEDFGLLALITASATSDILVERLSDKLPITIQCTGVMGPQILPYVQAGQVNGVSVGLKGGYDVEYMMKYGVNFADEDGVVGVRYPAYIGQIPPVPEGTALARGTSYYLTLHIALILLILAVAIGNLGMAVQKRQGKKS